jgi:dipeptidyl aminopeptidase/acylaminoacyl peptidase
MLRTGYIDPRRLYASGGSYGGYMVAWMNGHTDRYRAYVCHAGCFDWVSMFADDAWYWHPKELGAFYWEDPERVDSQNPRARADRMKTPTLVIHGLLDYRVPDAQALAYFNTLKAKGVPARLVFFPDENHWILKPQNALLWYREFFAWLERHAPKRRKKRRS